MTKEEAKKELEFYKNLASNHEAIVKGCNEKIIELETIINKHDRWQDSLVQPDKGQYFYLVSNTDKGLDVGLNSVFNRKPEHAFRTQEQAELIKEKALLMQEMHAFAHVKNEGWIPAWENEGEYKFGIKLCRNKAYADYSIRANQLVFGIAVKSIEIAGEMIEEFGERIEEFYNKMY